MTPISHFRTNVDQLIRS